VSSLRASSYAEPILHAINIMDIDQLHKDIYAAQQSDKHCKDIITNITNCKDLWHYKCPYWDVAEL